MFDSQSKDSAQRPFHIVSVTHLAREGQWGIDAPRSYLVPVLLWFTSGQGRFMVDGIVRGFTAHNAIYLPANTPHTCDPGGRIQGSAVFFGGRNDLPFPDTGLHLRLQHLQKQAELNQLVDAMTRTADEKSAFCNEILFHQAALTLIWLIREAEAARYPTRLADLAVDTEPLPLDKGDQAIGPA